jgi:hypothetical protein
MLKKYAIASARNFLDFSKFEHIVTMLNLSPIESWNRWEDIDGNILTICKNKNVIVTQSDKTNNKTLDIFRKAKPNLIAKHSYWVLCLIGNKEIILSFLGNDGVLRSCYYKDNKWVNNISSLLLGFDILKYIVNNYIESDIINIEDKKIKKLKLIDIEESWCGGLPLVDSELKEKICHLIQ